MPLSWEHKADDPRNYVGDVVEAQRRKSNGGRGEPQKCGNSTTTPTAALHNRLAEEARGLNELLLSPAVKRRAGIELRPQGVDADAVAADEQIARPKRC